MSFSGQTKGDTTSKKRDSNYSKANRRLPGTQDQNRLNKQREERESKSGDVPETTGDSADDDDQLKLGESKNSEKGNKFN